MPLSDNEQRLLEQMERALSAEDPKFASAMRGASKRAGSYTRLAIGVAAILIGLVVLLLGVANGQVVVGVLGFLAMLAGTAYAVASRRRPGPTGVVANDGTVRPAAAGPSRGNAARPGKPGKAGKSKSSFMQRMEQRWDRRRDER